MRRFLLIAAIFVAPFALALSGAEAGGGPNGTTNPNGYFVVGDLSAGDGKQVEFWGAKWSKHNDLSGGSAPSAFKGYADIISLNEEGCPTSWSTDPGNSSPPPATVKDVITVIVTSRTEKSGPVVSGDVLMLAHVKTDPGYSGNPGHAGTGTLLDYEICGGATTTSTGGGADAS